MCINVEIHLSQLCSRLIFEVSWFAKWSSTYFILYIDTLATLFGSCWTNSLHLDIELGRKYNWVSFNMTWLLVQHRLVVNWDFLIQQPNDQKRKIYEWAAVLCRIFFFVCWCQRSEENGHRWNDECWFVLQYLDCMLRIWF